jgi:hypothetical protein
MTQGAKAATPQSSVAKGGEEAKMDVRGMDDEANMVDLANGGCRGDR